MNGYIDAEKLIAEIERQQRRLMVLSFKGSVDIRRDSALQNGVYDYILDIIKSLQQEQSEIDWEKELRNWMVEMDGKYALLTTDYVDKLIIDTAKHFYELGLNARKSIWHNVAEETPTEYGKEVIVACRNKNKEDGIWLYDLIQCWEGKWEPRENWETPVKWAYVRDLDNARNEE